MRFFSWLNISKFENNFWRKFFENSDCSRQKKVLDNYRYKFDRQ